MNDTVAPVRIPQLGFDVAADTGIVDPLGFPEPHVGLVVRSCEITPQIADALLARNLNNRKIKASQLTLLIGALERGEWRENGSTITFDVAGDLSDGQHRLTACAMSGIPFRTIVVFNLPLDAVETIDIGVKRSLRDLLTRRGEVHTTTLAAALGILFRYQRGSMNNSVVRPTPKQAIALLTETPQLRESTKRTLTTKESTKLSHGVLAAFHTLFSAIDASDADYFMDRLASGAGLPESSPLLLLRNMSLQAASNSANPQHISMPVYRQAGLLVKAWNAWRENRPMQVLYFRTGGANPETFPKPV